MASRSALRNPEWWISWNAACNKRTRVRSGSRGVGTFRLGFFPTANIPTSMQVYGHGCRESTAGTISACQRTSYFPQAETYPIVYSLDYGNKVGRRDRTADPADAESL